MTKVTRKSGSTCSQMNTANGRRSASTTKARPTQHDRLALSIWMKISLQGFDVGYQMAQACPRDTVVKAQPISGLLVARDVRVELFALVTHTAFVNANRKRF